MVEMKSPDHLREDIAKATALVQEKTDLNNFNFAPESPLDNNQTNKENYPVRYNTFRDTLTALRSNEFTPDLEKEVKFVEALNRLDRYVNSNIHSDERILRDHQVDVFEDIRTALEQGTTAGYIKLPTGAGKTAIFCELAEVLGLRTLVVVPTKDLLLQTRDQMRRFATTIPESEVGVWYSDQKDDKRQINITTYNSMISNFRDGSITKEDFDLVILDEAHYGLGGGSFDVVSELKESAVVIGFTATPEYHVDKSLNSLLDEPIHSLDAVSAIKRGILAPTSALAIYVNADLSNVKISTDGNYNEFELQKAVNTEVINQAAIKAVQTMFLDKKAIAFCAGIQHAEDLAKQMTAAGLKADFVHGNDPQREDKLNKLKNGEIDILCNADLLIAGFDCPSVSVCLNLAPTASRVRSEQRGGRATRLDPSDPNKHAVVVDFIYPDSRAQARPVIYSDILNGQVVVTPSEEATSITRPDWLVSRSESLKATGIDVILTTDELARVLPKGSDDAKTQEISSELEVPNGWKNKVEICKELHLTGGRFEQTLDRLSDKIAANSQTYLINKRPKTFYSPELQDQIQELSRPVGYAPKGWISVNQMRQLYGISQQALPRFISEIRRNDSANIATYFLKKYHRPILHVSPEGIKQLESMIGKPPPKNWERFSVSTGRQTPRVRIMSQIVNQLISEGAEHGYFLRGKTETLYISPEVNHEANRRYKEMYSLKNLSRELEIPINLCESFAKEVARKHPECFPYRSQLLSEKEQANAKIKDIRGAQTQMSSTYQMDMNHLSQDGFDNLRQKICNTLPAKSSWLTAGEITLANRGLMINDIERVGKKLITDGNFGAEHRREYISRRGIIQDHYSPELTEGIINYLKTNRKN
jgi:superfamily II DNA or RNA helicase